MTDTTPGTFTFTVPNGVTSLFIQLDGAGGGGGGSSLFSALTVSSHGAVVVTLSGAMNGGAGTSGGNGEIILTNDTPAAVPEASTTVSLGLLLALGVGSVVYRRHTAALSVKQV